MPEILKSKALIINAIRWHETSKIVTLYAREWGKIKVIARGALRPKSSFGGKLESLNLIEAIISSKESRELQILTQADVLENFTQIRLQMERLPYALAILELLNLSLEEHQADALFFDFCEKMLSAIEISAAPTTVLWYFLLKLSSFLGFKPNLDACNFCKTTSFKGPLSFLPQKGVLVCGDCSAATPSANLLQTDEISFLQILQRYPHRKIAGLTLPEGLKKDFTPLLLDYLNVHIERNIVLKSLDLLI